MMPLAPTSVMAMPTSKPKIGFSIDSIVGNGLTKSPPHFSPNSEGSGPMSPLSDCGYPTEIQIQNQYRNIRIPTSPSEIHRALRHCSPSEIHNRLNQLQNSPTPTDINRNLQPRLPESPPHHQESPTRINIHSPQHTRLSPDHHNHRTPSPLPTPPSSKGPIVVPGIPAGLVRPFPHNLSDIKNVPPYLNSPEMVAAQNPHFLAAQFQMAAALAHGQNHGFPPGGMQQHQHHLNNQNIARDTYPLYPWLLSRHGRIFPHRFPGSPDFTDFLLQPFRKPKRVRTAFSPSQLLKLEHAFESNHYVVGAERKTLAQALSLTETQVKVWFQNRRTKHKRMQQEDEAKGGSSGKNPSSPGGNMSYDEDELIDMDDCPSDEEDEQMV